MIYFYMCLAGFGVWYLAWCLQLLHSRLHELNMPYRYYLHPFHTIVGHVCSLWRAVLPVAWHIVLLGVPAFVVWLCFKQGQ